MLEGTLMKGYGGFYYVQTADGIFECSLRGRHRLSEQRFMVGDRVRVQPAGPDRGAIEELLPRRTELVRPPVANVEQVIIVTAVSNPVPDLVLLDRLLLMAGVAGVTPVVCLNKSDLVQAGELENLTLLYRRANYLVLVTSARTGEGLEELGRVLGQGISVMAGPSGVGKSSLLNAVQTGLRLKTGEVSDKLRRGRHTTRHVELLPLDNGGLVADTPGFSKLDLPAIARQDVAYYFPEMEPYLFKCRFSSCLHRQEPQCAVRAALEQGELDAGRYGHYLEILEEVIVRERRN